MLGLGPIGDMACRDAQRLGVENVIGIDLVPECLARAAARGVDVLDWNAFDKSSELVDAVKTRTNGRGADAVIDAVGMEADGSPVAKAAHAMTALLPSAIAAKLMRKPAPTVSQHSAWRSTSSTAVAPCRWSACTAQ